MAKFRMAIAIMIVTIALPLGSAMVHAAVELETFTGEWAGNTVTLEFATGSEVNHAAFHVWRSASDIRPEDVSNSNATRLTASPILGENACSGGGGGSYDFEDSNLGNGTTYYYFLESLSCGSAPPEFYGAMNDADSGLRLTKPGTAPPTNTATPQTNVTATTGTASTATSAPPTSQPTTAPGQPTNTPGPTGTLVPQATTAQPQSSATPRPTNTAGAAAAPTRTTGPAAPTTAPAPTRAVPPTSAPAPTQASGTNSAPPTSAPIESGGDTGGTTDSGDNAPATVAAEVAPTNTPESIAAAVSPVVEGVAPSGEMSANQPAPTPTLGGGLAASNGSGLETIPEEPIVATSSEGDGVDGLIQGLIGVILVGVVGLVGFIGWNAIRNRP